MIKAFVGHSFDPEDKPTITAFTEMFDSLKKGISFEWEGAEETQIKTLSNKVRQKMVGKNLFIGIFTRKHLEIDGGKIQPSSFWNKDKYIARKTDCMYGTSYWIIQESGYAIAQGMTPLFLIEKGVRELRGLHGDMENIPFERGKESDCFIRLNDALNNFLKENKNDTVKGGINVPPKQSDKEIDIAASENINVEEVVEMKETEKHKEKKGNKYYFRELYLALLQKNEAKFGELKKEVLEKYKTDEHETFEWQAKLLSLEGMLAQKDVLNDLKELQKKKPDNALIARYIGEEYEKYKNYEKAIDEYLNSAKKETKVAARLYTISLAAHAYVKNGQADEAVNVLLKELHEDSADNEKCLIYEYLAKIAKTMENDKLFTAFSEKTLLLNPSNSSLRFDLAYKYSNMGKDSLALYHYNILAANSPDSSNYNNLGVTYANLGMPSKAVESYVKASELGATIARANLAQKLLNEGFIDYADEQLKEARKSEDCEKDNVGRALSRIDTIREEENKKEKEVLDDVVEERRFELAYADAYSIDFTISNTLSGNWNSNKHGKIEIHLKDGNKLYGTTEEITEGDNLFLGIVYSSWLEEKPPEKRLIKLVRTFEGEIIRNRVFKYSLKIERQPIKSALFTQDLTITEFTGHGIINKEMNLLKMMEFDKDKKQSFSEMAKIL